MPDAPFHALAFDYGLKFIGVAHGQSLTGTAAALPPIAARDGVPDWTVVEKLLAEWRPQRVVVGLPLNMDGSESPMSERARKFAQRLHGRFGVPVALVDERLSSFEARGQILAQGSRDFRARQVDGRAAVVILESWLSDRATGCRE
ncbi:MAG TPA: Holliday junction resolvase RuvX [Spongiibacteraceae bacterium]|jgi:putative Holliday junction resolvase|nr:Holliday junction resolvase RuvX [Spongiibacteraceae bacterium]HUH38562.1 Holliday junction resolvase RuvX [Spongiibacteraceae bacterium]